MTPSGADWSLALPDRNWPVLPNTALGAPGGYEDWLSDVLLAVRWALERPDVLPDRLSFFGTSQGGGGSLLLASLLGAGAGALASAPTCPSSRTFPTLA